MTDMNNLHVSKAIGQPDATRDKERGVSQAIVDGLNELMAANMGLADVYHTAAKRLDDEEMAGILESSAEQHKTFVTELGNLVARRGGKPMPEAGLSSVAKRTWVTLKAAVVDDESIVADVAKDTESVLEAYGETIDESMPEDVRDLADRHLRQAQATHEKLESMSARPGS